MKNQSFLMPTDPTMPERELLFKGIRPETCLEMAEWTRAKQYRAAVAAWAAKHPCTKDGPWVWTNYNATAMGGSGMIGLEGELLNVNATKR